MNSQWYCNIKTDTVYSAGIAFVGSSLSQSYSYCSEYVNKLKLIIIFDIAHK